MSSVAGNWPHLDAHSEAEFNAWIDTQIMSEVTVQQSVELLSVAGVLNNQGLDAQPNEAELPLACRMHQIERDPLQRGSALNIHLRAFAEIEAIALTRIFPGHLYQAQTILETPSFHPFLIQTIQQGILKQQIAQLEVIQSGNRAAVAPDLMLEGVLMEKIAWRQMLWSLLTQDAAAHGITS